MDGLLVFRGEKLALDLPLHSDRTFFRTVIGLAQDRTEAILVDALAEAGVSVSYGMALDDLKEQDGGVVAIFSDGSEHKYDLVIGADGVMSTVRKCAEIAYPGIDLEGIWSIADVESEDWPHPGKIVLFHVRPGVTLVIGPLGPTRYRLVASTPDALKTIPVPINVSTLHRTGTFNISIRQAETYTKGSVHLAGDAAHCHAPIGGRGMNMGIADATELARRIVYRTTDGYSKLRHKKGAESVKTTEHGRKLSAGITLPRRMAFGALLTAANTSGPFKRYLGRFLVEF